MWTVLQLCVTYVWEMLQLCAIRTFGILQLCATHMFGMFQTCVTLGLVNYTIRTTRLHYTQYAHMT